MFNAINVEVKLREGETSDKLVKRFFKKCKKIDIVGEYKEKTEYFMTRSQKKRLKRRKNQFESKKTVDE